MCRTPNARNLPALASIAILGLILASCAKADNAAPAGTTVVPSTTSTTAGPPPGRPQAVCEDDKLLPVVQAKFTGATLADKVCLVPNAIVTAKNATGDAVVFLTQADGAWQIIADGPTTDAAALAPKTFSSTLLNTWLDKRLPPTPTSARAPGNPVTTARRSCTGEGANETCGTTPPRTGGTTKRRARTLPSTVTTPP